MNLMSMLMEYTRPEQILRQWTLKKEFFFSRLATKKLSLSCHLLFYNFYCDVVVKIVKNEGRLISLWRIKK